MVSEHPLDSSSVSAMGGASSSSKFVPVSFNHSVSTHLDNNNFLIWRKHILAVIRGHKLQNFIYGTTAPPLKFLSLDDENLEIVNKEYIDWEQQDQLLFSWIVSSLTDGIRARVVTVSHLSRSGVLSHAILLFKLSQKSPNLKLN